MPGKDASVGPDGEGDVGVAEPLADDFDGDAFFDQETAARAADVVEPIGRDAGAAGDEVRTSARGRGDGWGLRSPSAKI